MADFLSKYNQKQQQTFSKLNLLLPDFCEAVITTKYVMEGRLRSTLIHYMRDWHLFFEYLITNNRHFLNKKIIHLTIDDIKIVTYNDLVLFEKWLLNDRNLQKTSQSRRRSSVKVLFQTLYKKTLLPADITSQYDKLKLEKKRIIALAPNEQADLLDAVESGKGLSKKQKSSRNDLSSARDLALITLLLDTGLRIGELYLVAINNIDFDSMEMTVLGKGAKARTVVFSEETHTAIKYYINHPDRKKITVKDPQAIFLNRDGDRLSIRSMQKIVKKYSSAIGKTNITPHKLRSSAGLSLYEATGDIRVVAAQLGHEDISVTAKKYVEASKHKLHDAIRQRGRLR